MQFLQKILFFTRLSAMQLLVRAAALLSLLVAGAAARGAAYYSSAAPTVATPSSCGLPATCGGVQVATAAQLASLTLAANVYAATNGPVALRLSLTGDAPAGYRAGMLVSNLGTALSVQTLGTVTLRSYLDGALQESRLVDASVLQAALLTSTGDPAQLEFASTTPFDAVELELGSALALGGGIRVKYAYGVEPTKSQQVPGYASRFDSGTGKYKVDGCTTGINNPGRAVDLDLTNYATFASLAAVSCTMKLQVSLEGTAPAGYQAGFVVGGTNNLLNADLLGGLTLRTYRNNVEQQSATGTALLSLDLLPFGQQYVRFTTSQAFDAVSIERTGQVTALDNLQLYYGAGVASKPVQQIRSNWDTPAGHFQTTYNTAVCALCTVLNPENAADNNLGNKATIQVDAGLANAVSLRMDLNGGGQAGNRAGVVIGRSTALSASVLGRMILRTYDDAGNLLESRTGASLLTVNTLADGRQTISFNTTRDFASVSLTVSGVADLLDSTDVYYAFADYATSSITIVPPAAPLPVVLVSWQAQRAKTGAADLTWTTASEVRSARFVVERATSPEAGFVAVGTVAAAGSSASARSYALCDEKAGTYPGSLYYRLRQEDADGTVAYSRTVVVAAAALAAQFSVYPNPAVGHDQVRLGGPLPQGASVAVYSQRGQLLRQPASAIEGEAAAAVPVAGLAPGLYLLVLRGADGQMLGTQRLQLTGE